MKFRKKPVVIEAAQWFEPGDHPAVYEDQSFPPNATYYVVRGRQGAVSVKPGDWIIAEPDGSGHYPCASDIFAATYEAVE